MIVEKKELSERIFVPYQIVITINDKREHEDLTRELRELESISSGRWYELQHKSRLFYNLIKYIKNHV